MKSSNNSKARHYATLNKNEKKTVAEWYGRKMHTAEKSYRYHFTDCGMVDFAI